jgi:hypothetical protein
MQSRSTAFRARPTRPRTVVQIGVARRRIDLLTSLDALQFDEAWTRRTHVDVEGLRRPPDLAAVARLESETPEG